MAKDAFYFKHDYGARNDPKMVRLIRLHGWQAFGLAWAIIEILYEQGGRISNDPEHIAYELRAEHGLIEAIIASPVFFIRDGMIGSESVDRRLDERRAASEAGREFISRRLRKDGTPFGSNDRDLIGTYGRPNTRRGEERKGDITAAPSAADLSNKIEKAAENGSKGLFLAKMEDARLPFNFGDFKKGGRIADLPAETCGMILEAVPRLGLDLRRFLQERVSEQKADSNSKEKRK